MDIIIVTGPPYSGKGTQCDIIKELTGYTHISTGERCRFEKSNNTKIGKELSKYEESGDLVPDSLMIELFDTIICENSNADGIILDGYPRTINQVDDLLKLISSKNLVINKVINIVVPKEVLLDRAQIRSQSSTRTDDMNACNHIKRISKFEEVTKLGIEYMQTIFTVYDVNGTGNIESVTNEIKKIL